LRFRALSPSGSEFRSHEASLADNILFVVAMVTRQQIGP
jgi:hypothetical protein